MGFFNFIKDAGAKLIGADDESKSEKLTQEIIDSGLAVENFKATIDDGRVTVEGEAELQAIKEKVILMVGNKDGIESVEDKMTVKNAVVAEEAAKAAEAAEEEAAQAAMEAQFYTVERGDTLGGIAKKFYGKANKYPVIFEANKPMLKDANLIYPGQTLRIPPLDE